MSIQFKYELTVAQANMADNLAVQFKRDIDNCNNGSIETRKRYHKALEDSFANFWQEIFVLRISRTSDQSTSMPMFVFCRKTEKAQDTL